jgi:hypothetical protein
MLPPGTQAKLASDWPEGTRHQAKVELAMEMLGNGIPAPTVEATLSAKFPAASPREITDIIRWAIAHNPEPSHLGERADFMRAAFKPKPKPRPKKNQASRAVAEWMNGRESCSEEDLSDASAVRLTPDFQCHGTLLFENLYAGVECVNLVCAYAINQHGKAHPIGHGKTLPVCDWCRWFHDRGIPQTKAGAWARPNPVKEVGSGFEGAVIDADVTAPRFLLLESDCLPFHLQLCALANFRLPIAAILTSGGASVHAWVRLDCADLEDYTDSASRIFRAVERFGFDGSNKNPSRLSRLPGAMRDIRSSGDGRQRLLYLNPEPRWKSIA